MTDNEILLNLSNMLEPIREDISGMKKDISGMKNDISGIKGDISDIKVRVKKLELTQENVVIPRLNNIEACYVSTYERYKQGVEEQETMKQDVSILKRVVTEHSLKLQGIS